MGWRPSPKLLLHSVLIGLGSIAGYLFSMASSSTETERVFGFPIPWGGFEKVNGRWMDFISPLSIVILAVDFFCGIALIYLVALGIRMLRRKLAGAKLSAER